MPHTTGSVDSTEPRKLPQLTVPRDKAEKWIKAHLDKATTLRDMPMQKWAQLTDAQSARWGWIIDTDTLIVRVFGDATMWRRLLPVVLPGATYLPKWDAAVHENKRKCYDIIRP